VPFFLSNREAQVSQDILRLAQAVAGSAPKAVAETAGATSTARAAKDAPAKKSIFAFGARKAS
jgi:hypothetical protein